MPSSAAAIWSAMAASCSAIAATIVMRILHKNMLSSTKPEIVLDGWQRTIKEEGGFKRDVLIFKKITNAGKGPAFHVHINANVDNDKNHNIPTVIMSTQQVHIIAAGEKIDIHSEITMLWNNAKPLHGKNKYIPIEISIYCWCTSGYRHETIYNLMAFETNNTAIIAGANEVVPRVMLSARRTIYKAVWRLKLYRRLSKLPFLGNYFRNKV